MKQPVLQCWTSAEGRGQCFAGKKFSSFYEYNFLLRNAILISTLAIELDALIQAIKLEVDLDWNRVNGEFVNFEI